MIFILVLYFQMAGFLKKLEKGVNDLADRASKQVDKTVSEHRQSAVLVSRNIIDIPFFSIQ